MSDGGRFLWYSDTHLDKSWPWSRRSFVNRVNEMNPSGMFLTGDISSGYRTVADLEFLASGIRCPIYFVLGNHDYHFRSVNGLHESLRPLCSRHKNLVWMTHAGVVSLNGDVALVGSEGWYDSAVGNPNYLRFTMDWFLTYDFLRLSGSDRILAWRKMASESSLRISQSIREALETHKEVYVLTHFPPWPEADRAHGTMMENFWLPYNSNSILGKSIEEISREFKKKRITVLSGHTHSERTIRVRKNVECRVAPAKYTGSPRLDDVFIF